MQLDTISTLIPWVVIPFIVIYGISKIIFWGLNKRIGNSKKSVYLTIILISIIPIFLIIKGLIVGEAQSCLPFLGCSTIPYIESLDYGVHFYFLLCVVIDSILLIVFNYSNEIGKGRRIIQNIIKWLTIILVIGIAIFYLYFLVNEIAFNSKTNINDVIDIRARRPFVTDTHNIKKPNIIYDDNKAYFVDTKNQNNLCYLEYNNTEIKCIVKRDIAVILFIKDNKIYYVSEAENQDNSILYVYNLNTSKEKELLELKSYYNWYRGSYYNVYKLLDNKLLISTASDSYQSIYYDLITSEKKEFNFDVKTTYQDDKYIYYTDSGKIYRVDKLTYKEEQIYEMEHQYTSNSILYANDEYALLYADITICYIDLNNKTMTEMGISDSNVISGNILVPYNVYEYEYLNGLQAYFGLGYYYFNADGYEYYQIVTNEISSKTTIGDNVVAINNNIYYIEGKTLKRFDVTTKEIITIDSKVKHLFSDIDNNIFYTNENNKVIKVEIK